MVFQKYRHSDNLKDPCERTTTSDFAPSKVVARRRYCSQTEAGFKFHRDEQLLHAVNGIVLAHGARSADLSCLCQLKHPAEFQGTLDEFPYTVGLLGVTITAVSADEDSGRVPITACSRNMNGGKPLLLAFFDDSVALPPTGVSWLFLCLTLIPYAYIRNGPVLTAVLDAS